MTEAFKLLPRWPHDLVLLGVLVTLVACGQQSPSDASEPLPDGVSWRAGDGLLEQLDQLELSAWPAPISSPAVYAALSALVDDALHVIEADQFREAGVVPSGLLPELLAETGATWRSWLAPAPISLEPGLGRVELSHRGEVIPLYGKLFPAQVMYINPGQFVALRWRAATRELQVFAREAPGRVELQRERDATSAERERRLRRDLSLSGAQALLGPHVEEGRLRTGLNLPAGAALRTPTRRLLAERLEFAVSLQGEAWRLDQGGPVPLPTDKLPGVLAEWFVLQPEGEELVWSRRILAGENFTEERVELGAWRGQEFALELRLSADKGNAVQGLHVAGLRFAGAAERAPRRPHIVLIDIDTLRADRLGSYGNTPSPSPQLDAWAAAQATVYEDCIASSNWTLPSTVSLLTGLDPAQHHLMTFPHAMTDAHAPLAVRLAAAGYETRARTDAGIVNPAFGFHHGFERFDFLRLEAQEHERVGYEPELQWLAERDSERPVFVFLQTYMVHGPFRTELLEGHAYDGPLSEPPLLSSRGVRELTEHGFDGDDEAYLLELYDAGIERMDALLGRTLDALPAIFGDEPYAVLITSDHGEELLDHESAGHANTLYQELLRVPLIVRFPDERSPARVAQPTSALDVAPTVLEWAGIPKPASFIGRSLSQPPESDRVRVAMFVREDAVLDTVIWHDRKLLRITERDALGELPPEPTQRALFDLSLDPHEQRDRIAERRAEHKSLERALGRYREDLPRLAPTGSQSAAGMDAELQADLTALGYLGDG